jgi:hypothetical protein
MIENSAKDDDIWVYLPALKKVRRLVASNKKDSFVAPTSPTPTCIGYKVSDWSYKLLREDTLDRPAVYVVEALPRSARSVRHRLRRAPTGSARTT